MSKNNTQSTSFFSRHKFKIGGLLLGLVLGIFIPQAFALDGAMWLVSSFFGGSGGALAGGKIDSNYNSRKLNVIFPEEPESSTKMLAKAGILSPSNNDSQPLGGKFIAAAKEISARRNPANLSTSQDAYQHLEQPYNPSRRT